MSYNGLKRCPKCGRFDVEYNPCVGHERCLWKDCGWINRDNLNLDKLADDYFKQHGTRYKKFAKGLKIKRSFLE